VDALYDDDEEEEEGEDGSLRRHDTSGDSGDHPDVDIFLD